jgi:hypothetical protein
LTIPRWPLFEGHGTFPAQLTSDAHKVGSPQLRARITGRGCHAASHRLRLLASLLLIAGLRRWDGWRQPQL